jgi:hypothetical protein
LHFLGFWSILALTCCSIQDCNPSGYPPQEQKKPQHRSPTYLAMPRKGKARLRREQHCRINGAAISARAKAKKAAADASATAADIDLTSCKPVDTFPSTVSHVFWNLDFSR